MKNTYFPEMKNDSIFTFVGDINPLIFIVGGVLIICLIIMMMNKKGRRYKLKSNKHRRSRNSSIKRAKYERRLKKYNSE